MKNKIIALVLVLTFLSGVSAYAVPNDVYEYDARFERLFTVSDGTSTTYDIIQKIVDYTGVAELENIKGQEDAAPVVILGALAEIVGLTYEAEVEATTILDDLKAAKYMREAVSADMLTLQDLLYAAARITGWAETDDIDALVYSQAKKAGLLRNLTYSSGRSLTKSETAQFLYNVISIPVKKPKTYEEGVTQLDKDVLPPILESKYGIVLKKGVVMSVFGESIFNENSLKEDEIEIGGEIYDFNTDESRSGLVGRSCVYFFDVEDELVIFAEPTTENTVYELTYGGYVDFGNDIIEYELDDEESEFSVNSNANLVYNGMSVGAYTPALASSLFKQGTTITAIDNDEDGICDVIMMRRWESFIAAFEAGGDGNVVFDYGMQYNGKGYIDLTPDDKKVHISLVENGEPTELSNIVAGSIISISGTVNASGHTYIIAEITYNTKSGVLSSVSGDSYIFGDEQYAVSESLLKAFSENEDIDVPSLGATYTFYTDIAGQIAKITVPDNERFGFLVRLDKPRSTLATNGSVKIFDQDGKMITAPTADKVTVNINAQTSHTYNQDIDGFVNVIVGEARTRLGVAEGGFVDYRSIIRYRLSDKGELEEIWLPLNNVTESNTPVVPFGETGYPLTKDIAQSGTRTYYGVLWGGIDNTLIRMTEKTPIFNVPGDFNAKDERYTKTTMNQAQYNGYISEAIEVYSVDSYSIAGAGVNMGATGGGDIKSDEEIFVVDKVVSALNENKDIVYKVYGWLDGVETTYITTDEELTSEAGYGATQDPAHSWAVVKFTELKFGDIIQSFTIGDEIKNFRVVFRASDPGADRIQIATDGDRSDSGYDGQIVEKNRAMPMLIVTGTYDSRKLNVLKIMQNGVYRNYFMYSNRITDVYILDMNAKTMKKTSVADLQTGDKIMLRQEYAGVDDVFVIK